MTILNGTSDLLVSDLKAYLRQFGLEELAPWAASLGEISADEFIIKLEEQPLVQERFAPVFERRDAIARGDHTVAITMGQVIEADARDRALEQEFGLPTGMVDTFDRLNNDVSGAEIRNRVQIAVEDAREVYSTAGGKAYLDEVFGSMPGLDEGGVVALFLDPDVALPKLRDSLAAAAVSAGSTASGFRLSVSEANELARRGITEEVARANFGELATLGELTESITGEVQTGFSRGERIALAAGDPILRNRLETTASRRRAEFGGGGGFAGVTAGIA